MSTRSGIGIINEDGTVDAIYCHYDGYLEYNGSILNNHYQDVNKIRELIALGDISGLGANVNPADSKHSFDDPQSDVVVAYHRDGGEPLARTNFKKYENLDEYFKDFVKSDKEYLYLYDVKQKEWRYAKDFFVDGFFSENKSIREHAFNLAINEVKKGFNNLYDKLKSMDPEKMLEPAVDPKQVQMSAKFKNTLDSTAKSDIEDQKLEAFITKTLKEASESFELDQKVCDKMTKFVLDKLNEQKDNDIEK